MKLDVAASRPPDAHLVMVLDGAGWHVARDLRMPQSITLVFLPAYSPELNPVERLWLYLRERFLSLRLLPSTEAVVWSLLPSAAVYSSSKSPGSMRSTWMVDICQVRPIASRAWTEIFGP